MEVNCKYCNNKFEADSREVKRGNASFCSRSCGSKHSNANRVERTLICSYCCTDFKSKAAHARYCSAKCKSDYIKSYTPNIRKYTKSTLSRRVNKALPNGTNSCFECPWNKTTCDIHHIIPQSQGGSDSFDNLTILCPNCHRLADRGMLTNLTSISTRIGLYHHTNSVLDALGSP